MREAALKAPAREPLVLEAPSSPWPNQVMAARALARFIEETRETLALLEMAQARKEAEGPGEKERVDLLKALAGAEDPVELLDLPQSRLAGRDARRRLVRGMAEEGLLQIDPDPTYPNMLFLRITSQGREELQRRKVQEAMGLLSGDMGEVYRAVMEARQALRRLAEATTVGS